MELRNNYRKLTTALSRFWHREAGPMNLENPRPRGGLYRLGNFQRRGLFGGCMGPVRRPGQPDFPGKSPHRDPLLRGGVRRLELCPASFSGA